MSDQPSFWPELEPKPKPELRWPDRPPLCSVCGRPAVPHDWYRRYSFRFECRWDGSCAQPGEATPEE